MLTDTSRFSSLSSANGRSFRPPKPTYNSPKLVGESLGNLSPSQEPQRLTHPFAAPSYSVQGRSTNNPEQPYPQIPEFSRNDTQAFRINTPKFDRVLNNLEAISPSQDDASTGKLGSVLSHVPDQDTIVYRGDLAVGAQRFEPTPFAPPDDFLLSSNTSKSQFDDSDDEEKLDVASRSLSGMPHRARLAAIGTASRLFKGRRHSRGGCSTQMPNQDLPAPLKLDKRASKQREGPSLRPSTSDGMSPLPRQAVFGHRPSPSELSFFSKPETACSIVPADRDLILGLQGNVFKSRPKPVDKREVIHPLVEAQPSIYHRHLERTDVGSSVADGKTHWLDPPPYCASEEPGQTGSENRRTSQSSSTLPSDPSRRPVQMSPDSDVGHMRSPLQKCDPLHAESSARDAFTISPLSTLTDNTGSPSCGRIKSPETITDCSPKRIFKAERLPPQKPPPRSCPPPPPTNVPSPKPLTCDGSLEPSTDVGTPSPASAAGPANNASAEGAPVAAQTAMFPAGEAALKPLALPKGHASLQVERQQLGTTSQGCFRKPQLDRQVVLDVGGTKFVTLVSTLQGAEGDHPRLIEELNCQDTASEKSLCLNRHLALCKCVGARHRGGCGRSESGQYKQGPQSIGLAAFDKINSTAEELFHELGTVLGLDVEPTFSQSSTSSTASTSGGMSQTASDTSTRRTSDVSDASSWSDAAPDADHPFAKQVKAQCEAMSGDSTQAMQRNDAAQVQELVAATCGRNSTALPSSRLGSPLSTPQERSAPRNDSADVVKLSSGTSLCLFVDRNCDLYRDLLDILRAHKLPYRLLGASVVAAGNSPEEDQTSLTVLKLQLRCRLHEIKDEAEYLGYFSVAKLCEQELLSL